MNYEAIVQVRSYDRENKRGNLLCWEKLALCLFERFYDFESLLLTTLMKEYVVETESLVIKKDPISL